MAFHPAKLVQPADDSWKATAFLNFYLPTPDGGQRKIGAIALKDSKAFEKAVIERLTTGGEEAVKAFMNVLMVDFHRADTVTPVASVGF